MGRKCAISACMSDSNRDADRGVTFHKIPMHPDIRPKWMSLCRIPEDKRYMKVIYVCSRHFLSADFCNFKGKKYMLKQGVLPSVFPWNKNKPETKFEGNLLEIEPEIKLEEGETEIVVEGPELQANKEESVREAVKTEEEESLGVKTDENTPNMNSKDETLKSPNQSTTIEQKVKTIDTATGPLTFAPNTRIEALHCNQTWCPARIIEVDYQENEVLVHFDQYPSNHDEWIGMNSSALRAPQPPIPRKQSELFEVGERCLATWSDSRKFPATVTKIVDKDAFEVHFDDGYVKVLSGSRMAKVVPQQVKSASLFDPVEGTKQDRRDRKRKLDVAALFKKRSRANSQDDKTSSTEAMEEYYDWQPKWKDGKPVGEESMIEMNDGIKKTIIVQDPRLPANWIKHLLQRTHGTSIGKWDTIILSPEGRRFRTRSEVKAYLDERPELNLNEMMFDFSVFRRTKGGKGNDARKAKNEKRRLAQAEKKLAAATAISAETVAQLPQYTNRIKEEETEVVPDNSNSLKIQFIDNAYKCPIEGCGKNFRRENLAQMHVKHYHPEYTKYLDSTPNVADLAYARTVGESLDRSPSGEKSKVFTSKPAHKVTPRAPPVVKSQSPEPENILKVRDSEIIKLLSGKPDDKRDGPTSPILPSGLHPSMYPDIKLKDLLTKSQSIPRKDDLNLKALSTSTQRPSGLKLKDEDDNFKIQRQPVKRKKFHESDGPARREELPPETITTNQQQDPVISNNNVIIEGGEVIKIVRMKQEEIINCTCGLTEEDGLMIQCELCLCWQHAYCNNIQHERDVPEKYVCFICQNPTRQRSSRKFYHDQDWLKHGHLPVGNYHCKDDQLLRERFEKLKKTHDLTGGLLELKDYLQTLRMKMKIAEAKNHPKLYLWSKPWEKLPLPEKTEVESPEQNENVEETKVDEGESMLMTLLKSKDPSEASELMNTLMGNSLDNVQMHTPRIPQPEAAIDSADCRLNLLDHISHSQSLVEERLADFEEQINKLDSIFDNNSDDSEKEATKVKQTTQMLMRDLATLKELSTMNTF